MLVLLSLPGPLDGRLLAQQPADTSQISIYLVDHGWHAGLVVPIAQVPPELWPERLDFPGSTYLEIGWGDEAFYRDNDPSIGTTLKAALIPTSSVLHVVGFDEPVERYFPGSEIIRIEVTPEGFAKLCRFIHDSYKREKSGVASSLGPGLYGHSQFYRAIGSYSLARTCNTWTAQALQAGGCPISPAGVIRIGELLSRVRRFGTVIQKGDG